jgi:hypothetical protein
MSTSWRADPAARGAFAAFALAASAALAGCESDTADLIRELEAARGDCTMDAMRAASDACVQMFERYAEIGSEAINTYIGGVRALDEALRRTGGLALDTAGLPGAVSDAFLPDRDLVDPIYAERSGAYPGLPPDPYGDRYPGAYGAGPGPYPDPYSASPDPYFGAPDGDATGAVPRSQRGVLLPPEIRLSRPWIEPDTDARAFDDRYDRAPGYWPGSAYGVQGGTGSWGYPGVSAGYGIVPGYGYPPAYGGYGYPPYGTVPGLPGYQGYGVPPGYYQDPRYGGYPGGAYPGYGPLPGADPWIRDPRYDSRSGPDTRSTDRTNQRPPRAYDP